MQGTRHVIFLALAIISLTPKALLAINNLSSLAKNDPFPVFTTLDPQDFLYTQEKLRMMGFQDTVASPKIGLSFSPFGQNADCARNINNQTIPLGDVHGRFFPVGLLFGCLPKGVCCLPEPLAEAFDVLFPNKTPGTLVCDEAAQYTDPNKQLGFFSIELKYKKRGIRFEGSTKLFGDFGLTTQFGIVDICQSVSLIRNVTCSACTVNSSQDCGCSTACANPTQSERTFGSCTKVNSDFNQDNINKFLMNKFRAIACSIGLDTDDFNKFGVEDLRFHLFWRKALLINSQRDWYPEFMIYPYWVVGASIATGKEKEPCQAWGLPFTNNGHHSVGATLGIDFDFVNSIEVGAEGGLTHFFDEDFCNFFVPTSKFQSGIYPYSTNVTISPGLNWHFSAKIAAYQFLENLSFFFQYVIVQHKKDHIKLKCCDDCFCPQVLEDISFWKVQVANIGFNYDISPNVSLGFLWQAPLSRKRAYRSTTVMFGFNALF